MAQEVIDEAFEIRRLADVHARAGGVVSLRGFSNAINAGAEKFIQDIVLVGRHDELVDGHAHHARDMSGADVAEIPDGTVNETF